MARPHRVPVLAAVVALLAAGCSGKQRIATELAVADVLISPEQERQLGLQVKQELEQKQHVRYLEDPTVTAYVQEVTGKILPFAKKDRPEVEWSVKVIDDPNTVNAFATPGGFLYVYSGLLVAADDTAEVAGVLGHEAGHVVARHSARQMVNAYGLQAITALALGQNPSAAAQIAASLAGTGALLAYSRSDEIEADEHGARYASAAGYDPHGIATFFEKLQKEGGSQPGWASFLSTHPATGDRIAKVNRYIEKNGLTGSGGRSGAELAKVKARLKALPPPPEKTPAQQPTPQARAPAPGAAR
jgi:beta-barrel assembly-enhancing protease